MLLIGRQYWACWTDTSRAGWRWSAACVQMPNLGLWHQLPLAAYIRCLSKDYGAQLTSSVCKVPKSRVCHPVLHGQMARSWFTTLLSFSFLYCTSADPQGFCSPSVVRHSLDQRINFKHSTPHPGLLVQTSFGLWTPTSFCLHSYDIGFVSMPYMAPTCFSYQSKFPAPRSHPYLPMDTSCYVHSCQGMAFPPSGHSSCPHCLPLLSLGLV